MIAADGLSGDLLADAAGFRVETAREARVGAGAVADRAPPFYESGTIFMLPTYLFIGSMLFVFAVAAFKYFALGELPHAETEVVPAVEGMSLFLVLRAPRKLYGAASRLWASPGTPSRIKWTGIPRCEKITAM